MNIQKTLGMLKASIFRVAYATSSLFPLGNSTSFGSDHNQIGAIIVINLKRQPLRLRRTLRELKRVKMASGEPLISITTKLAAVDARDGREVASSSDVDPEYVLGDQLYVQPDEQLEHCFSTQEPITMTRQEVAVARSHIEAWKVVANGEANHVLILEDDIWFRPGGRLAIDRGWEAATKRFTGADGPELLYLSFSDADGTADRRDVCADLFRPERGLWFLSGYVLSRQGSRKLLKAMPVKGPVDMWINQRFNELRTLALSSPAILQRRDSGTDNSYSVMPYLARAGIVDADAATPPPRTTLGPILVLCSEDVKESLAMALSILGLRVRVFDTSDTMVTVDSLAGIFSDFDALVAPQIEEGLLTDLASNTNLSFLLENSHLCPPEIAGFARTKISTFSNHGSDSARWTVLCELLGLVEPAAPYPIATPSEWRLFRDDRDCTNRSKRNSNQPTLASDKSAWALSPKPGWPAEPTLEAEVKSEADVLFHHSVGYDPVHFRSAVETFPGNLASFELHCVASDHEATSLTMTALDPKLARPYSSGALISTHSHQHGRFEACIRAAKGNGLVTGFFLHRASPRQEIDFEIMGHDPTSVLLNVYFNPGDVGTNSAYGYRGSPCRIPLGFDASLDFHRYSIEWNPDRITWAVDGRIIHQRGSWDPTPVPHLPMKLHFNLWAPRSQELAGLLDQRSVPAVARIKNVQISA
jgi:GR25 family glycosyltransferase involved in LPS biosynthesis